MREIILTRGGLPLLEDNSKDGNTNTDAESSEDSERHLEALELHAVQIVHVLGVEVVRLVMAMSSAHLLSSS